MTDKEYYELIQPYEDAMKLLLTRLEVLNHSIYKQRRGNPFITYSTGSKRRTALRKNWCVMASSQPWKMPRISCRILRGCVLSAILLVM